MLEAELSDRSLSLHGLVLAGGRSTRMARPKPNLAYGATSLTFARAAVQKLVRVGCQPVCLSLAEDQAVPVDLESLTLLRDPPGLSGPPAAFWAAWDHQPTAAWLVLACDLPRVSVDCLQALISAGEEAPEAAAIAFHHPADDRPEPLCALYRPSIRASLPAHEAFSPRRLLEAESVCRIQLPSGAENALNDCDFPDDYAAFQADTRANNPD
ncbi:MAG: molybdenum cofactor guanylyltransferase [Opitutales bacterium]